MSQFPDSTITDGIMTITYKELLDYASNYYSYFNKDKFGITCESMINTIKAIFCCLYSNSTAVMMSKRYGENYINSVIEKTRLSFLVEDDHIKKIAPKKREIEDLSDVAYIMCTSGTTGKPKAAMLTYENILCNVIDISRYFKITSEDKVLITRPLCHAAALTGELFVSLINGADITLMASNYNPFEITNLILNQDITVFCCTPTVVYQLAEVFSRKKRRNSLRKIAISGECVTKLIARKVINAFNEIEVFNVYGLTEASPRVSYLPPEKFGTNPDSVGIALNSVKLKIVNNELYVSGKSVMKGYYDDPELTQKVLKNGWLKTGDIAKFDSNGMLYVNGRIDNMIIRAGINIYPQEIENALMQDKHIVNVMAYGIKYNTSGEKIGIKVVGKGISKRDTFAICKKLLPSYQIPDIIELVSTLPQTESGKLIRNTSNPSV